MSAPFWKMHGAGNDFILLDDRALTFPANRPGLIADLCRRRTGIGSDGLVLLQPSATADIRMRFFNPDGSAAGMCGNAARCTAWLARHLDIAADHMTIETDVGILSADIMEGLRVKIHMPPARDWRLNLRLEWQGNDYTVHFVDSGVPHAIVFCDDVSAVDMQYFAPAIRRHPLFAPTGTNVDFVQLRSDGGLAIRTYERGVEAETLACGTGVMAAALIAERLGLAASPVDVATTGGDHLQVTTAPLTLAGPVCPVYTGSLDLPALSS